MKNKKEEKRKKVSSLCKCSSASCLLVHSSTYADYRHMILLGFLLLRNYISSFLKIIFVSCSFFILIILLLSRLPHMDSPLSRSPGSSVLIGVGLPTTRPSSVLGGPQRLEYCCTPPHSSSLPALAALPAPPTPRLVVFQWPMGCELADAPPPSRV